MRSRFNKLALTIGLLVAVAVAIYFSTRSSVIETERRPRASLSTPRTVAPEPPPETSPAPRAPEPSVAFDAGMEAVPQGLWGLPELVELEKAAMSGDANAQFMLSVELRRCYILERSFKTPTAANLQSLSSQDRYWQRCAVLASDSESFEARSKYWDAQAQENGSLHARALQLAKSVDPSDASSRFDTERQIRRLIESQDPFVYYVVHLLKTDSFESVEGYSWKLLACTSRGAPAWLCVEPELETEPYCGTDGCSPAEYHTFMLARHPGIYDQVRARAEQLRGILASQRFDELDLRVPAMKDGE